MWVAIGRNFTRRFSASVLQKWHRRAAEGRDAIFATNHVRRTDLCDDLGVACCGFGIRRMGVLSNRQTLRGMESSLRAMS
jgi:hypothetical protein